MKRILALFTMLSAAVLARAAGPKTLLDWSALPQQLNGHALTLIMTDGARVNGKLIENKMNAFSVDVASTPDGVLYPQGKQTISYASVAEVHATVRRFSFRKFADAAFIAQLDAAIHANGFFTLIMGWVGGPTPIPLKIIDTLSIPFWLGWAAGGLAITPVVAPVGYLRGSDHYDYRVR